MPQTVMRTPSCWALHLPRLRSGTPRCWSVAEPGIESTVPSLPSLPSSLNPAPHRNPQLTRSGCGASGVCRLAAGAWDFGWHSHGTTCAARLRLGHMAGHGAGFPRGNQRTCRDGKRRRHGPCRRHLTCCWLGRHHCARDAGGGPCGSRRRNSRGQRFLMAGGFGWAGKKMGCRWQCLMVGGCRRT